MNAAEQFRHPIPILTAGCGQRLQLPSRYWRGRYSRLRLGNIERPTQKRLRTVGDVIGSCLSCVRYA
jgi:hypothetical protein